MSGNVLSIHSRKGVVQALEDMLDSARSGKLTGIAVVGMMNDGAIIDGFSGIDHDVVVTIGALRILERRIVSSFVEIPEEFDE